MGGYAPTCKPKYIPLWTSVCEQMQITDIPKLGYGSGEHYIDLFFGNHSQFSKNLFY